MGGSVGGMGGAIKGMAGGKSSGLGQGANSYGQGYTPVGGTPQRSQPVYQAPQQQQQQSYQPQYMSGSAMGGFGGGFNPYAQQPMQPQFNPYGMQQGGFGGKSSGYGQMGMMGSPYGQQGFNPYGGGFGGYGGGFGGGYGRQMGGFNMPQPEYGYGGGPEGQMQLNTPMPQGDDFISRRQGPAPSFGHAMGSVGGLGGLAHMLRGRGATITPVQSMQRPELQAFFNEGGKVDE